MMALACAQAACPVRGACEPPPGACRGGGEELACWRGAAGTQQSARVEQLKS